MNDQNTRWCDKCGYHIAQQWIEDQECPFWECPLDKPVVVDTGDDLHRVLGEALSVTRPVLRPTEKTGGSQS